MTLRLADLEKPLDEVEFPNGAIHVPVPFGAKEYALWRDIQTETDAMTRGQMLLAIVAACYPNATPDDLDSCTPTMLIAMAAHAGRKIDQIRDALKNVAAAGAAESPPQEASATPRSSPKTSGATSSRSTRKRSAKTGSPSTTTDDPSASGGLSTISTTPNASVSFAASSTTSTAPF